MALDTAIKNVGDYYAAHYLADKNGFTKDIRDQAKAWKEQGSQSAPRRLAALGDSYFKAKTAALDFPEPELRSRAGVKELDAWHPALLDALGYRPEPFALELATEKMQLPALLRLNRHNRPWLVILQAPFCLSGDDSEEEPLEQPVQAPSRLVEELPTLQESWEKAIALLFKQEDAPRWAMLLAGARVYLFDAQTYAQGRYLWIDLEEAYGRRQAETFQAICALLSVEALSPQGESDEVLHERLREGSLKSTHGVSEKLQGAVRDAIQAIANGWVEARRQSNLGYRQLGEREAPLPDGSREITAEQLRHDALIFVYRLLFCFYAEARGGELGILPINDDVYRLGYSLEALRDLVDANEPGTTTEQGTYIAEHLERLFQLIYEGFDPAREGLAQEEEESEGPLFGRPPSQTSLFGSPGGEQLALDDAQPRLADGRRDGYTPGKLFAIEPLTATLFDPAATPLLSRVKLPNRVLHGVIRCLSLGTSQQSKRIGRINYAELGIVQLGSVYEGLLSYKGFFATEDLIQVHQQIKQGRTIRPMLDNAVDPKQPTWFVPATRLDEFKKGEVVLEHRTQKPRIYRTGEFILHLNGVDRVNSASYYTPEVLTRTLVEEALKERLKAFTPEQADEVLSLKVCEPAMGSAAFLVEAIDQLAHRYLELKQQQLGQSIDPSDYEDELRRVRHYIAVHNVYGVDLNPVAVELGALSLWLATIHRLQEVAGSEDSQPIHRPAATPWFGLRLRAGNSLIGARRSVWSKGQLGTGKHYGKNAQVPRQLKPSEARKPGEIYHFLVWDEDMAPAATDKLMREHWPEACEQIKQWRNRQVKEKYSPEELARLEALSERIDALWADYAAERHRALAHSACTASVWPTPQNDVEALRPGPSLRHQERLKAKLEAESGAFQRLRLLMDSWCSFYFWPLEQAETLPSREAWLAAAEVLLGIGTDDLATRAMLDIQLGEDIDLEALFQASQAQLPDAAHLSELVPWFGVGRATAAEQHYHHWELIFTEILGPRVEDKPEPKGFDLMFGNPPWLKVTWSDAPLLSEFEPLLGVRDAKSVTYNRERPKLLQDARRRLEYRTAFEQGEGSNVFLNDATLYPALAGVQTNLYKNFIERSWGLIAEGAMVGFYHEYAIFDDAKGGGFRKALYPRLRASFQYQNWLPLFADVGSAKVFCMTLSSTPREEIGFRSISNVFHPQVVSQCDMQENLCKPVPALKDDDGKWEMRGHPLRTVWVTSKELELFAKLLDDEGTPYSRARLPQVHSQKILAVLEKFAKSPRRLGDLKGCYYPTEMFHESNSQRDGIITRQEKPSFQPESADEWVVSGPHFYASNPFAKTARTMCKEKSDYDLIDLSNIQSNYLPRAVYRPGDENGDLTAFYNAIPEWPKPQKPVRVESGWQPGFWPVDDEDVFAYEVLLGEKVKRYCIDTSRPGTRTARKFGFFNRWDGDVEGAIQWLKNNRLDCDDKEFLQRFYDVRLGQVAPTVCQMQGLPKPITSYARHVNRKMVMSSNERTLIASVIPPGASHMDGAFSIAFSSVALTMCFSSLASSVVMDFLVRMGGKSNLRHDVMKNMPFPDNVFGKLAAYRYAQLICVAEAYKTTWDSLIDTLLKDEEISSLDFASLEEWDPSKPCRSDLERRLAGVDIDVLAAFSLGLSLEELIQIYEVQFSVMKSYEEVDEYDSRGMRLPNTTRKDAGGKEVREARADHDGTSPLTVSWEIDNGNQTVTRTFYPPFRHVDRIEDYRTAYRVFAERLGVETHQEEFA
ncbi:DNA methyltransferase [Billgrantia desiderata]|uniref:DNA methyltransferase n=1 Tax=Billgrantia desiderata TaxID=52021 RepID=UPI00289B7F69